LEAPDQYWIHADAGGTPKMECARTAPDYCYYQEKVKLMGWSAHGNGCGGFGKDVPDEEIRRALLVTARRKVADYPGATHYIFRDNGAGGGQKICGCAMPGMPGRYGLV
jgi:hypothetical protein